MRTYPHAPRPIGPSREYTRAPRVRLVRHENIPTRPASDWSVTRVYTRVGVCKGSRTLTLATVARFERAGGGRRPDSSDDD
eukprot:743358-Pyramimonas_sp.AAC.1